MIICRASRLSSPTSPDFSDSFIHSFTCQPSVLVNNIFINHTFIDFYTSILIFNGVTPSLLFMNEAAQYAQWQHRIAVADDEEAFLLLYRYFKPRLEKFAYSIVHVKEDAEEIVEDVFVRVWMKRKTLDQVQNLKLYIYVATRNFSLNYLRVNQRNAHLVIDELKIELQDITEDPEQLMSDAEQLARINYAVAELPNRCKIIFKLVKEDGLKQREVAELLHLSLKTVENQLAIAIKRLAQAIGRKATKQQKHTRGEMEG